MEVSEQMVTEWKEKYGSVFILRHPAHNIYYRTLSRVDYIAIMQKQMSGLGLDPEVETVKICVLNEVPEDLFDSNGGLATVVYEQIMLNSGFVQIESEQL
jgi:hypothetical protein